MIRLSFLINFTMSYLKVTFILSLFFYGSAMGFQYWTIAQFWPPGYCAARNVCLASKAKLLKFTIHGLWPSNYPRMPHPSWCSHTPLDVSLVSLYFLLIYFILILYLENNLFIFCLFYQISAIINELNRDWPSYLGKNDDFWKHEWEKHGSCSNMLPFDYFRLTLDIYARNDLQQILEDAKILPGSSYSPSQIINAIQISLGVEPFLICERNYLTEIRLCLNKNRPIPQYTPCNIQGSTCPTSGIFL